MIETTHSVDSRSEIFIKSFNVIESFLEYLRAEKGRSALTVEAYGRDLRQFVSWLTESGAASSSGVDAFSQNRAFDPVSVTTNDIRAWIGSIAEAKASPATLRRKVQSLRTFYQYLLRRDIIKVDPTRGITLAKKRKPLPNFIKEEEMEAILSADAYSPIPTSAYASESQPMDIANDSFKESRTHLVLNMLYSLGLRQAELLGIKDSDIDFNSGELRVTGKRNKQRVVPLPSPLMEEIRQWQRLRDSKYEENEGTPRKLLDCGHGGMSKSQLYNIVRDGLSTASTGRKSPHTLRHTFATSMINDGADLDTVREMLGHTSLATTQVYTHVSIAQMLENYKGAHPRSKKD